MPCLFLGVDVAARVSHLSQVLYDIIFYSSWAVAICTLVLLLDKLMHFLISKWVSVKISA